MIKVNSGTGVSKTKLKKIIMLSAATVAAVVVVAFGGKMIHNSLNSSLSYENTPPAIEQPIQEEEKTEEKQEEKQEEVVVTEKLSQDKVNEIVGEIVGPFKAVAFKHDVSIGDFNEIIENEINMLNVSGNYTVDEISNIHNALTEAFKVERNVKELSVHEKFNKITGVAQNVFEEISKNENTTVDFTNANNINSFIKTAKIDEMLSTRKAAFKKEMADTVLKTPGYKTENENELATFVQSVVRQVSETGSNNNEEQEVFKTSFIISNIIVNSATEAFSDEFINAAIASAIAYNNDCYDSLLSDLKHTFNMNDDDAKKFIVSNLVQKVNDFAEENGIEHGSENPKEDGRGMD